jgi:hypothetical protein
MPDPTIDSVWRITIRPADANAVLAAAGVTLAPGTKAQFCAFAILKSGKKVKTQNSWNVPACESAFQAFLAERSS